MLGLQLCGDGFEDELLHNLVRIPNRNVPGIHMGFLHLRFHIVSGNVKVSLFLFFGNQAKTSHFAFYSSVMGVIPINFWGPLEPNSRVAKGFYVTRDCPKIRHVLHYCTQLIHVIRVKIVQCDA